MTHHSIDFSGRSHPAELLKIRENDSEDLALFFVRGMELFPSYALALSDPAIGTPAWMVGYPGIRNGSFRETRGKIERTRFVGYDYKFNRIPLSGESGAPVFVAGFKVVGVVSHRSKGDALITNVKNIRAFLTETIGAIPKCNILAKTTPSQPPVQPTPNPKALTLTETINHLSERINVLENKTTETDASKLEEAIRKLILQNVGLKIQIANLSRRVDNLKPGVDGVDGRDGAKGQDGSPGTVTVILVEDGVESKRVTDVRSGSTVRLNVKRVTKETN